MKHSVARIAQQSRRVAAAGAEAGRGLAAPLSLSSDPGTRERDRRGMGLIPGNAIAGLKWRSPVYFDGLPSSPRLPRWILI